MIAEAPGRLLPLEEALDRMLEAVVPLGTETLPIGDALGRVLAVPLDARVTLPPWDNSAMDGFAVRQADVADASDARPVTLRVVGESAAGHPPTAAVARGTALRILTGATLPEGADAVVPVEATDAPPGAAALPEAVAIRAAPALGAHVRRAGGDLVAGQRLLEPGTEIRPSSMALVAASGHGTIAVHRRPRVAVLGTGDEFVAAGEPLGPAQIHDSNSPMLVAQARSAGAEARQLPTARDDLEVVLERLRGALDWADVIVASGGVSVGAHDVVKAAFEAIGRMDLWRVAVQPGKPLAFGRAERPGGSVGAEHGGRVAGAEGMAAGGDLLLFGLPGNPVSSFVTFELFVRPVVRRLAGRRDLTGRRVVRARLADPVDGKARGRRAYLRVRLAADPARPGSLVARLAGGQGSHVLSALAAADGLAIVPEEIDRLPAGAEVDVIEIEQGDS